MAAANPPAKSERIRTPWKTWWRRFCGRMLPIVIFAAAVVVVGRLWIRQGAMPGGVGRVEAVRVDATATSDGKLLPLAQMPRGTWKTFDTVQQGQIVARLDDRPLAARLRALQSEAAALRAELVATDMQTSLNQFDRSQEHLREAAQLVSQVERYRLDALEHMAGVEEARLELQRMDVRIGILEQASATGMGTRGELTAATEDRASLEKLMRARSAAQEQAEANLTAAQERLSSFPELQSADVAADLGPIREAIQAAEARADEATAQIDALVIRSPISGTIAAVHVHPGQGVRAGDPIVTIASGEADSITAYVPATHRFRPEAGMAVGVRLRVPGSRMVRSVVQQVGSQWEPMPRELLRDPQTAQLALPVQIRMPQELGARPGELVDIRFYRKANDGAALQAIVKFRW